MLGELKGLPLLQGARGAAPCDLDAIARAVSALSVFAVQHAAEVESVEVNPLRAFPGAQPAACLGLDALIVRG
jgi:acetate---CoA ligase (ADP-forming)